MCFVVLTLFFSVNTKSDENNGIRYASKKYVDSKFALKKMLNDYRTLNDLEYTKDGVNDTIALKSDLNNIKVPSTDEFIKKDDIVNVIKNNEEVKSEIKNAIDINVLEKKDTIGGQKKIGIVKIGKAFALDFDLETYGCDCRDINIKYDCFGSQTGYFKAYIDLYINDTEAKNLETGEKIYECLLEL